MPANRRFDLPAWTTAIALLAGLALVLTLSATGHASEPARPVDEDAGPQDLHLNGTVVDEDGVGLADVELRVQNTWENRSGEEATRGRYVHTVTTNSQGHYAVDVSEGHVEIQVDEPGYQQLRAWFEIREDRTIELPMQAEEARGATLEVTVTSGGEPLEADVTVRPADRDGHVDEAVPIGEGGSGEHRDVQLSYRSSLERRAYEHTGQNGTVTVRLEPGAYEVRARADGHVADAARIDLAANETRELELSPRPVPPSSVDVEGTVVDAETGDPVPGARVTVVNDRWGAREHARADADGRFRAAMPPGPLLVTAEASRHATVACADAPRDAEPVHREGCSVERDADYMRRVHMDSAAANETLAVTLELPRAPADDATIAGWAVNATSDEAIEDATVTVRNEATGDWGRVRADANGSFAVDVRAGYYTVRVDHPDHPAAAVNVQVESGEETRLAVEVPPGPAHEEGRYHAMPAPVHAEDGADGDAARTASDGGDGHEAAGASGQPTYEGSGGGLGAYTDEREGAAEAPTVGAVGTAALAAVGALAVAAWTPRRR